MLPEQEVTRILIVEEDEGSFEFCRTLADRLDELPPLELFHARDATEALSLLETIAPDVLVIDDEHPEESELLLETLGSSCPPIVFCTGDIEQAVKLLTDADHVTCVQRPETLEGLHQTLRIAAALGMQSIVERNSNMLH